MWAYNFTKTIMEKNGKSEVNNSKLFTSFNFIRNQKSLNQYFEKKQQNLQKELKNSKVLTHIKKIDWEEMKEFYGIKKNSKKGM